jgi:6-phosphogluconate dehydrogenase
MDIGIIGLGRMGANIARRLLRHGHHVTGYNRDSSKTAALAREGATAADSAATLAAALATPRTVWIMLPADVVDATIETLLPHLAAGDTVIDGGNSYYRDDIRRAAALAERGIHYLDIGTSGGVWGRERGYCLMIGGDAAVVARHTPLSEALAPGVSAAPPTPGRSPGRGSAEQGYLHCGGAGAGHFVEMVHNGIEYGLMAAYAEGLNLLASSADLDPASTYRFDLGEITELWRRGSVIGSWLLDLAATAFVDDAQLEHFEGRVADSGEGRWTVRAAVEAGVPVPVLSAALYSRFESRDRAHFANQVLSALRHAFGGHLEPSERR